MYAQCAIELPASEKFPDGKLIRKGDEVKEQWFRDADEIQALLDGSALHVDPPVEEAEVTFADRVEQILSENPGITGQELAEKLQVIPVASGDSGAGSDGKAGK